MVDVSRFRSFIIGVALLTFSVPLCAQRHGVMLTGGICLPNDASLDYIRQATGGVGYLCEWQQNDGWQLGWYTDVLTMHNAIAGARFSSALSIEDRFFGPFNEFIELGLACYTNPYKHSHDENNIFIGSYLNCHIGVGVRYRFQIDSVWSLSSALRFVHSSNGYLLKPNKGLNYLTLELGFHYEPQRRQLSVSIADTTLLPATFFCSYAPSVVQQRGDNLDASHCYAHSLLLGVLHPFSRLRSLGGEVDLMYNFTHDLDAKERGASKPFPLYVGVCVTYQRNWEPLFMRASVGTDLIRSRYQIDDIYERVSLNYRIARWGRVAPYVGVACKAYYFHIDYIEWTLGFEF